MHPTSDLTLPRRAAVLAAGLWLISAAVFAVRPPAISSLVSPVRLALVPWGDVLVSDYARDAVLAVDPASGEVRDALVLKGRPLGVAWGGENLFVGNASTASVEVYRRHKNGKWQPRGLLGGKGAVADPTDIAVDELDGLVFVLSGTGRTIHVFDFDGGLVAVLGGPATLLAPTALAVDSPRRELVVSDYGDPRAGVPASVRVLDYGGALLAVVSGESEQPGFSFSRPQGLAVVDGRILFADALLGQVLVFDRGTLRGVATLGSYGSGPGQLLLPLDLAVEPFSLDVLVSDNRNARIEVFAFGARP